MSCDSLPVEVVCLGEALIDFICLEKGVPLAHARTFERAPGGAPANVAVALARLGVRSGFVGKVGDEEFGRFLASTLADNGVDTSALLFSDQARTALAFVSLKEDAERDFMFYRHPSADMLIRKEEIDQDYIKRAKVFHFGSISLITEPSRGATLAAVRCAQEHGLIISYDPNLRLSLWPSATRARRGIELGWQFANVVKISEQELAFLVGTSDPERGADQLLQSGLKLLAISLGREGCFYATEKQRGYVSGYHVAAVDATGAGDGFVAGLLAGLLDIGLQVDSRQRISDVLRLANAVGALTVTKRGAIPAFPTRDEVVQFIKDAYSGKGGEQAGRG
jgi:fructokinase